MTSTSPESLTYNEPILVVDDNKMNLKLIRVLLEAEQYKILTATSGQDALQTLGYFHPSLILVDVMMPGMDGIELVRRLKAEPKTSHIPILVMTSDHQPSTEKRAKEAGCDGYVTKPFDTQTLPKIVAHYLGRSNS